MTCRANLRHGRRLYSPPRKACCGFFPPKNPTASAGIEPYLLHYNIILYYAFVGVSNKYKLIKMEGMNIKIIITQDYNFEYYHYYNQLFGTILCTLNHTLTSAFIDPVSVKLCYLICNQQIRMVISYKRLGND